MSDPSSEGSHLRLVGDDDHEPSPFDQPVLRFAQSTRADYSLRWTETGIALPPPPESVGDWPSDRWRAHLATCGPVRQCRHRVDEPGWWVLMAGRGIPLHADAEKARAAANEIINRFRSHPVLPPYLLTFVQEAVRDALIVAPQPVTEGWVDSTNAIVASLVRTVAVDGGPLTREHVFSQRVRDRFLYVHLADYKPNTVNGYRCRLDLVTMALNGVTVRAAGGQPGLKNSIPQTPLTPQEEAAIYPWAVGLRPDTRRQKLTALAVLGLGVGPLSEELLRLKPEHVTADSLGIHVELTNGSHETRVVTCRREWEERLAAVVSITPPGHYLIAPWRDKELAPGGYHATVWQAQEKSTPPVYFNAGRLRNTWFVRQMEAGVPLTTLLEAADLETLTTVYRLLPHCQHQSPAAAMAALRGETL